MLHRMLRRSRVLLVAAGLLVGLPLYARLAPLDAPESRGIVPGTVVLDVHGTVLEHDRAEGLRIAVTLDAVAPRMLQATVSAEDRRFWRHPGVDPLAAAPAVPPPGPPRAAASRITQQL